MEMVEDIDDDGLSAVYVERTERRKYAEDI
jgi:hypothetical protein